MEKQRDDACDQETWLSHQNRNQLYVQIALEPLLGTVQPEPRCGRLRDQQGISVRNGRRLAFLSVQAGPRAERASESVWERDQPYSNHPRWWSCPVGIRYGLFRGIDLLIRSWLQSSFAKGYRLDNCEDNREWTNRVSSYWGRISSRKLWYLLGRCHHRPVFIACNEILEV